jgi:CRP-like cAMP-binding protein
LASPQGGERIIAILAEGSVVGDLSLIDGARGLETAVALRDSRVRFISRSDFQACASRYPAIHQHLLGLFTQRLREAERDLAALSFLTARGRVAQALLKIAESLGADANEVTIPGTINQREIAAFAGVARENANRILRTLEQQRLLSKHLRAYCIHDRVKLQREVEG